MNRLLLRMRARACDVLPHIPRPHMHVNSEVAYSRVDPFQLLELLYVFLSSSKSHEKFMEIQKARGGREVRLKKLSETRWSCRYNSIAAILATFLSVLETLESIMNDSDRKRALEAKGILAAVTKLKFIACLVVY